MSQDTLNKVVTVLQAASFGLILWDNFKSLVVEIERVTRLNNEAELKALISALEALNPNTHRRLAWEIIKNTLSHHIKNLAVEIAWVARLNEDARKAFIVALDAQTLFYNVQQQSGNAN